MGLPKFDYIAPETLGEACRLLKENPDNAKVMAGGTDLLIKLKLQSIKPKLIIGLRKIEGLDQIRFHKRDGLFIGATALLADVSSHPKIKKLFPSIAYAASQTANVQVRNMGTVVGNLCNAAPSADNAPTLIAMGAELIITGTDGERTLPLEDFFRGPGQTALRPGEIVTAVHVPLPPPHSGTSFQHISPRGKVDISAVCVGVMVVTQKGRCFDVKIALGAVAPIPMRAKRAEDLIKGKKLTLKLMEQAGAEAAKESKPITDVRASAEYRKKMVAVLTKRALMEAHKRATK